MDFSSSSFASNNQHASSFPAFSQQLWNSTEMKFLFYAMIFVTMVQAISIMTSSSLARRPRPIKIKNMNSFIKRTNRKSRKNIRRWFFFQNKIQNNKYVFSCKVTLNWWHLFVTLFFQEIILMGIQSSWKAGSNELRKNVFVVRWFW